MLLNNSWCCHKILQIDSIDVKLYVLSWHILFTLVLYCCVWKRMYSLIIQTYFSLCNIYLEEKFEQKPLLFFVVWDAHKCLINIFLPQVPELAGFWLLTLLLQTPLTLFLLLNGDTIILPLERAVHIIMSIFVLCEIFMGYFAIRALVNHQVTKFHLQQFTNLEHIDPDEYMQQQAGHRHEHRA